MSGKQISEKIIVTFMGLIGWMPVYILFPFVMLASLRNGATGEGYIWPYLTMLALAVVVFILQMTGLYWLWANKDHKHKRMFIHSPAIYALAVFIILMMVFLIISSDLFQELTDLIND